MYNEKVSKFKKNICGKKAAVLGVGVSNLPLTKFLTECGAHVTVHDRKTPDELGEGYDQLVEMGVDFQLGPDYLESICADIIFKTPGMRLDLPELVAARERGSVIASEMELFFQLCPAPIIAVTGSDGKTTTTSIIYHFLKEQGYICHLGGNIGRSLIGDIDSIHPYHKIILELSSFQLHTMSASPQIAVVTNITPNHLDVHKTMEEYVGAKSTIFTHQSNADKLVLNYDNPITHDMIKLARGEVVPFSMGELQGGVFVRDGKIYYNDKYVMDIEDIILPGRHNIENYIAAIGAVWGMVDSRTMRHVAKTFKGIAHRIEYIRTLEGVRYYNDSIATSPARATAGLMSFDKNVVLIAGGYDKKLPFDEFGHTILEWVKKLILIGDAAHLIKSAVLSAAKGEAQLPIIKCSGLEEAVSVAKNEAESGDVVLLSPACASFDMFKSFEERGECFKSLVKKL